MICRKGSNSYDWNNRCNREIRFYVADLVDQQGIASIHLARSPERAKVYASAEIRKMVYANTPEVVEALKGIDVLLMVSARENPERVEEHKSF